MKMTARSRGGRTEGFALVLSLLFTGIVLLIVVSTAASLATGARQSGANERRSYQAMLVAESGLNTLPRRAGEYVRTTPYTGSSTTDLQTWLGGLKTYIQNNSPVSGNTLTLTALTGSTFTASSRGATGGALKILAQDYAVNDRTLPPGLRPHSGLTSRPKISASGSSKITPTTTTTATTVIGSFSVGNSQTSIVVGDSQGLNVGDYIIANGNTLRIDGVAGTTLKVTRVIPTGTATTTVTGNVDLILNAAAETPSIITNTMTIKASNVTDFSPQEKVTFGQGAGARAAVINAINAATGTLNITWSAGNPSSIPEGTAISRDTYAMASGTNVTVGNGANSKLDNYKGIYSGTLANDCTTNTSCYGASNSAIAGTTTSSFTQLLFGLSDNELNDLVPLSNAPQSPLTSGTNVGLLRIRASDFSNFFKSNGTYTGVVIVDQNLTGNVNGTTLNGFLYLRGGMDGKFNGNMEVNGSVAVNGDPATTTNVLNGNISIKYNAVNLRIALSDAPGSKELDVLAGTWRQQ